MLTKEQEYILRWLLSLKTNVRNTITVINTMPEYPKEYTDKQLIQKLNGLEMFGLITIKWYTQNRNDLDLAIDITISKDGINYFANKKATTKENRRRVIESHFTFIIALIALLKSFDTEIIWLLQQLMQLMK